MAPNIIKKPASIGAFSGLGLALLVALSAWLNQGSREPLQTITNFIASVPMLLVTPPNLPGWLELFLFISYWAIVGGALGWLVGQPRPFPLGAAFLMIVGLIVAHRMTQVKLERELEAVLRAIGEGLTGGTAP